MKNPALPERYNVPSHGFDAVLTRGLGGSSAYLLVLDHHSISTTAGPVPKDVLCALIAPTMKSVRVMTVERKRAPNRIGIVPGNLK